MYFWRKSKTKMLKSNNQQQCTKGKNKKTLVIAQEIKFARLLADNDKRIRDKVLKSLKKWLTVRSQSSFAFTEMDFMSLWKGLFYCMWMSDKMLIQEELAESLSKIVHCLNSKDNIILYTTCALKTLATEWFGIDQYRLDKFSMLVRRILRQTFVVCKDKAWDMQWIKEISQIFEKLFLCPKTNLGFSLHVTEIYLEELAKNSNENLSEEAVSEFIRPFVVYLITTKDERQMKHIMKHIFRYLIFQSDIGIEYMEKFAAWRQAGFPCTHLDDMKKLELSDMEDNSENKDEEFSKTELLMDKVENPLDPRAGRVDVELPQISFNPAQIVQLLSSYKFHPSSTTKSRRQLSRILQEFKELSEGKMPLGTKKVRNPIWQKKDTDSKKAALRLIQFEKDLYSDNINNKRKRNKRIIELDTDTVLDIGPPKKQKKNNLTHDEVDCKSEFSENKTKLEAKSLSKKNKTTKKVKLNCVNDMQSSDTNVDYKMKSSVGGSKKSKTAKKIKLNCVNDMQSSDTNVDYKMKTTVRGEWPISEHVNQCILPASVSQSNISTKKTAKKRVIEKTVSEKNIARNNQVVALRNKSHTSNQMKGQTDLNNSTESRKKVKIVLHRNTAQLTSEYIQQVRRSPTIPFDANKKPLVSVLKASPIPSPVNPFYKKG
ncbi:ribosomal RNA processing protein 1 homolog isoform X2 [Harpegnathos saltator]|uniref:ribosomal RNA processing protein 1 homolog isoform X2 n=1 Tax=Harpegnathos saltator TaxID=610380 RepID=UPI0005905D9F|nr:ribosomal RNA processing protein 1 homolog isoform X2 [Harpegnathos saltator]